MPTTSSKQPSNRSKPWWKTHEEVSFLFEKLYRPLERDIRHDTRQRDIVGKLRQLDVGVIDHITGEKRVKALVEVQKRRSKVDIQAFGSWIYKRDTLQGGELIVVSEKGFTASVLDHVRELHTDTVRLGKLHEIERDLIEPLKPTDILGVVQEENIWWFASIFAKYADDGDIVRVNFSDPNDKIFGASSPMDLVMLFEEEKGNFPAGQMLPFIMRADIKDGLSYLQKPVDTLMLTVEKQRKISSSMQRFFAYSEVYPDSMRRGIAIIADFKADLIRKGRLTLAIFPTPSGLDAGLVGQIEIF